MPIKLESLRADERKINDGTWVEIPDLPDGDGGVVAFLVRGASCAEYQAALSDLQRRQVQKYRSLDAVPPDIRNRDSARLIAKHLMLDWRGFDEPFSRELAEEMLMAPGEFVGHVSYAITQVQRTEAEFVEDAAKNSGRSSAGGSKATQSEPN